MKIVKSFVKGGLAFSMVTTSMFANGFYVHAAGNRVNYALNKPVSASHFDSASHTADKAVDGDLSTRWGTDPKGSNQWLIVDLENNMEYDEFYIASEASANQKIKQYKIEGSNDNQNFELIYQADENPAGYDLEQTVKLDKAVNYRYVKITIQSLIDGAYPSCSLREFGIIGSEAEDLSAVKDALNKISIPNKVYRDFKIPLSDEELGVEFNWKSDNDAVTIENDTVRINPDAKESQGSLTVEATKGEFTQSQSFGFTVEKLVSNDYSIYPLVQNMTYGKDVLKISDTVNVVGYNGIDENLVNYIEKLFGGYQIDVTVSDKINKDCMNVLLGVKGQEDAASKYLDGKVDDSSINGKDEGYVLKSIAEDNVVCIVGNDAKGTFNGVFTLEQMVSSSSESLKDVTIIDAPDTKFRGIIEGFYGEYSHKDRLDLLKFMGPIKMNTYIYGAKSDPYHRAQWRDLYPEQKINEIAELVQVGKQNNVDLVWSAHIGGNINMGSEDDYNALIRKFDQLYDIGVRQFGLFYDDAYTDPTHLVEFVNKLNREYIHKKEGVKDLIICPEQYCKTRVSGNYLDLLAQFDKDVQIMWTGDSVISEITPSMMEYIENRIKRPAYIWWNYPVNDLGMGSQLLVGQTVGLSTDMGQMNGLVSNPMLQSQASKFSLFSIADYGWNIAEFDKKESWENAVDYIIPEDNYAQAFKTFAANNNQSVAELQDIAVESDYLIDKLDTLRSKYYADVNAEAEIKDLINEFKKIEDSCQYFKGYKNKDLVNQINPWLDSLTKVAQAGQSVLENILLLETNPMNQETLSAVHENYLETKQIISNVGGQWSGRRVLLPFIKEMQSSIENVILNEMNDETIATGVTNYRDGSYSMMDLSKMLDGDVNTYTTVEQNETNGKWFGVDLGSETAVDKLEILMGKDAEDSELAAAYKVQISNDGINWKDIKVTNKENTIRNTSSFKARFVRVYCEKGSQKRIKIREFKVNPADKVVYTNVDEYKNIPVNESKNIIEIDEIKDFTLNKNQYLGIQFAKAQSFSSVDVNDELKDLTVEYSVDGRTWNEVGNETFVAKYIRIKNDTDKVFKGPFSYFRIAGPELIEIEDPISVTKSNDLTIWEGSPDKLVDHNRDTYIWTRDQANGQNYVLDLKKEYPIKDINVVMVSGDVMESGVVELSSDGSAWHEVGKIGGKAENLITLENETARYIKVKVTSNSSTWLKINEIEINQQLSDTQVPVIANGEKALDKDIDTSMSVSDEIIYNNINDLSDNIIDILKDKDSSVQVEGYINGEWKELGIIKDAYSSIDFSDKGKVEKFRIRPVEGSATIFEISVHSNVDKTALDKAVKDAEKLDGKEYTASTWTVFAQALDNAKAILDGKDITQDDVDNAAEALSSAKEALVKRASEQLLEVLSEKVSAAEATKDMYEAEDFVDVQAAIDAAKALLANPEEAGSLDAVNVLTTLQKAVSELSSKPSADKLREDLEETVKYVKENILNDTEGLRPGKVQELKDAIAEAEELLANPEATADELSASLTKVTEKVQELWEIVNKDELNALIETAKAIKAEGYTEESYNALQEAIKAAEKVAANDDATTTEVKEAISSVAEAIANLEKEAVLDKTALEKEISLVEKMVANIDDYVASTVKGLEDKLNEAKDVLANATTQEEIDEAVKMLREARLNARTKADKEALKEAIETAKKYDLSKYTKASAQALRNAMSNAEKVMKDEAATQEEVDAAVKALDKTMKKLVLNANVAGEDEETSVKTGVTSQAGAFAGMLAVAGGAAITIALKKKKEDEE